MSLTPSVVAEGVSFAYGAGASVFENLDFSAVAGHISVLTGPSGAGKSTLLYVLAGVLPAAGVVKLGDVELPVSARLRARIRLASVGFVFQRGEMLPELSLTDNVALPLLLIGERSDVSRRRANELLDSLGLASCAGRRSSEVSGGQAQRASVARALVHAPKYIFADEPTGSLDSESRDIVVGALQTAAAGGACVIVATHDQDLMRAANHRLTMKSSRAIV